MSAGPLNFLRTLHSLLLLPLLLLLLHNCIQRTRADELIADAARGATLDAQEAFRDAVNDELTDCVTNLTGVGDDGGGTDLNDPD